MSSQFANAIEFYHRLADTKISSVIVGWQDTISDIKLLQKGCKDLQLVCFFHHNH